MPPPGLRPYVGFKKLSTATVRAVVRVVDGDPEFRERIASAVSEDEVGRAGWVWLTRPSGWEDELVSLEDEAATSAAEAEDDKAERDARRRLAAARTAAEKATAMATARAQEAADVRAEMVEERARRRVAETHAGQLEAEIARVRAERLEAVRQLKDVESKLADRAAEIRDLRARVHDLEREAKHAGGDGVRRSSSPEPSEPSESAASAASSGSSEPAAPEPRGVDRAAVADAVRAAARGAAELATALTALESLVAGSSGTGSAAAAVRPVGPTGVAGRAAVPPQDTRHDPESVPTVTRRVPRALPGGMLDDSIEAAEYLFRVAGMTVLVDGYNVSMVGWPDVGVAEQRRRLVAALGEAAARTGATVEVVFDGAEVDPVAFPKSGRQPVRVRFSPPGVEADDVLLELVEMLPPVRPVAVVSSDNRVRAGSRRLGANLIHAHQVLKLLGR